MDGPIVAGTDGSDTATKAVLEAIKLAVTFDQTLHLVSAYKAQVSGGDLPKEFADNLTPHAKVDAVLEDVGSRARQAGAKVEVHAVRGDAADAILDVAEQVGAALIVVGNRGISSARRFVLGNVPSKVVHHSPCSTYIVNTT